MIKDIKAKQIELYREFRQFKEMSDDEKLAFKAKIALEASQRTEDEKEEYRVALKANVLEIKEKVVEIREKIDKTPKIFV